MHAVCFTEASTEQDGPSHKVVEIPQFVVKLKSPVELHMQRANIKRQLLACSTEATCTNGETIRNTNNIEVTELFW